MLPLPPSACWRLPLHDSYRHTRHLPRMADDAGFWPVLPRHIATHIDASHFSSVYYIDGEVIYYRYSSHRAPHRMPEIKSRAELM